MKTKRIFAVHLLNDYSGSPLVFSQAIEALQQEHEVHLFTAIPNGSGFLSNVNTASSNTFFYKWSKNKAITLLYFLLSQTQLFSKLLFRIRKADTVYINTLLPFGAAIAAYIKGCRIVYHVHEISIKPSMLKSFLVWIAEHTAHKIIFVSNHIAEQFKFTKPVTQVVNNALPEKFIQQAASIKRLNTNAPFTVLMLCSLKAYKGVYEFVEVAKNLPKLQFQLVLNTSAKEVEIFRKQTNPSQNCQLFPAQQNTLPFYEKAHLVLNLSRPTEWVETFGMTILEAMHCGRPVIVPPVGGPCELVEDGVQGFHIHSENISQLTKYIQIISSDFGFYKALSLAAQERSTAFDAKVFNKQIQQLFSNQKLSEDDNEMENLSANRNLLTA